MSQIKVVKITDSESRALALKIVEQVYFKEKKWIHSIKDEIPGDLSTNQTYSWFLATVNGEPAGALRLFYDPPLQFPEDFKVTLNKEIDLVRMAQNCRFVEIGRFMILPKYRRRIRVALRLMALAIQEVVQREYTHFITDVFEGEPNSPYQFHTRVLGFEVVGTHLHGELNCSCTRIILTLDILKAYGRLKQRKNKIYYTLTTGIRDILDKKLESNMQKQLS